jgi:hypothetical protein
MLYEWFGIITCAIRRLRDFAFHPWFLCDARRSVPYIELHMHCRDIDWKCQVSAYCLYHETHETYFQDSRLSIILPALIKVPAHSLMAFPHDISHYHSKGYGSSWQKKFKREERGESTESRLNLLMTRDGYGTEE